jgi:hypothetical protein
VLERAWEYCDQRSSELRLNDPYADSILGDNADRDIARRTGWDEVYWDQRNGLGDRADITPAPFLYIFGVGKVGG